MIRGAQVTERLVPPALHPEFDDAPRPDGRVEPEPSQPRDPRGSDELPDEPGDAGVHGLAWRSVRTAAFHLGVIAAFAVPAVVLWWHVWSGHPASTLTCACGDPAQQVWFTAWPAWAVSHLHNPFFSGAVNVPDGANLLSNTSGTLVGIVLAPVTWAFGPVVSTNVALVLAPALSAWGCYVAVRALVSWWPGAAVAALVYGYSAAIVTSLVFSHVSVTLLVVPPLLFAVLHEIVVRQARTFWRDGAWLAALLVLQFLISPEVLVMCGLLAVIGLAATAAVGWRQVPAHWRHAARSLGLGCGVAAVLLAYPAWFGVAGRQSVTGVLFVLAPFAGLSFSGVLSPGQYAAAANVYVRFGGYLGHNGPSPDYIGGGAVVALAASVAVARRRPLTWLLLFMGAVTLVFGFGDRLIGGPSALAHVWLPWFDLSRLPLFKEIIADQFAPLFFFFVGALLAVGLDALYLLLRRADAPIARHTGVIAGAATVAVAALALAPVFVTFDVPLRVSTVTIPPYMRQVAPTLPAGTVLLTVPFPVPGTDQPMLWQAVDDFHFRLAGGALKTPNKEGGPIARGVPGSARHILTSLSVGGSLEPSATPDEIVAVRAALGTWQVDRIVIAGTSRDPVYASGFITAVLGAGPVYDHGAWVWQLGGKPLTALPVLGISLANCRASAAAAPSSGDPLAMARCVLFAGGRPWTTQP